MGACVCVCVAYLSTVADLFAWGWCGINSNTYAKKILRKVPRKVPSQDDSAAGHHIQVMSDIIVA